MLTLQSARKTPQTALTRGHYEASGRTASPDTPLSTLTAVKIDARPFPFLWVPEILGGEFARQREEGADSPLPTATRQRRNPSLTISRVPNPIRAAIHLR